ncbi:hypothetical protein [Brevibacillus borstelensis]|uniref:hypothetical protein n=1 Tax=Brevibacillus borstelensis TaxID=45462 RepID=UPI0030C5FD98
MEKIYRIIAQTETLTITAQTKETTEDQAIADAKQHVLSPSVVEAGGYQPFVILPICTEEQWKGGNINFCPRCGASLLDEDDDSINDSLSLDCLECNASLDISIHVYSGAD